MKASVIVPAYKCEETLPRTLRSLENAAQGLDVEIIVIEDPTGRGPSWARNRGLEKASGEFIFFCDADDTVEKDFFAEPMAALEEQKAQMCFFEADAARLKSIYSLRGREQVRSTLLPLFFGFSFEDVRRWNCGEALFTRRELGYVWRVAFRADFLRSHGIVFDERMYVCEDAAFLSECVFHAENVTTVRKRLYCYRPGRNGLMASAMRSRRHWDYKFAVLDFRKRLIEQSPEDISGYCRASHVFSALEMLTLWKKAGLTLREFKQGMAKYLRDPVVSEALENFPLSLRHPLAASAVTALRLWRAIL